MKARQPRHDPVPLLEWVVAALGALVALALIGIVGFSAVREDAAELPRLRVEVERVAPAGDGHVVAFTVRNGARRTAKQVHVEGALGAETASATLDYVPGRSAQSGVLLFRADAGGGRHELNVTGYQLP